MNKEGKILSNEIFKKYSVKELSEKLNLASGTINRWKKLDKIPKSYNFDLLKLLSKKIDYSKYTSTEKDQFFTPSHISKYCYEKFCKIMKELKEDEKEYTYIEPSAGDGSFLNILPKDRTIALDIEPRHTQIIKQDYFNWKPNINKKKYIVFGNPPFGLRGHLALRFINHSVEFADFVVFILPQLFDSDGKGSPKKRIKCYNLVHSEKMTIDFYDPDKRDIRVNVVFQIWSKNHKNKEYEPILNNNTNVKIYSLSDGGTPSSTRNKKMLNKCDIYLPSTCFGKENMKYYNCFEDLPCRRGYGLLFYKNKEKMILKTKQIDWTKVGFLSTNSAYNIRSSLIYSQFNIQDENIIEEKMNTLTI